MKKVTVAHKLCQVERGKVSRQYAVTNDRRNFGIVSEEFGRRDGNRTIRERHSWWIAGGMKTFYNKRLRTKPLLIQLDMDLDNCCVGIERARAVDSSKTEGLPHPEIRSWPRQDTSRQARLILQFMAEQGRHIL